MKVQPGAFWFDAISDDESAEFGCKFDGCIHMQKHWNQSTASNPSKEEGDIDHLHICDPLWLSEQFLELCRVASTMESFPDYWPSPLDFVAKLADKLEPNERQELARRLGF